MESEEEGGREGDEGVSCQVIWDGDDEIVCIYLCKVFL